jgi:hypothetical protein
MGRVPSGCSGANPARLRTTFSAQTRERSEGRRRCALLSKEVGSCQFSPCSCGPLMCPCFFRLCPVAARRQGLDSSRLPQPKPCHLVQPYTLHAPSTVQCRHHIVGDQSPVVTMRFGCICSEFAHDLDLPTSGMDLVYRAVVVVQGAMLATIAECRDGAFPSRPRADDAVRHLDLQPITPHKRV